MTIIEHDDVIEQIPAAIANKPLGDAIPPWALEARSFGFDAEALHRFYNVGIKVRSAVEDEKLRRGISSRPSAPAANDRLVPEPIAPRAGIPFHTSRGRTRRIIVREGPQRLRYGVLSVRRRSTTARSRRPSAARSILK